MSSRHFLRAIHRGGWAILLAVSSLSMAGPVRAQDEVAAAIGGPLQLVGAKARKVAHRRLVHARHAPVHNPAPLPANAIVMRTVRTMAVDPTPTGSVPVSTTPPSTPAAMPAPEAVKAAAALPAVPAPIVDPDVKAFCGNVGRAASDARIAWQAAKLVELEGALKKRIEEFEAKVAEHRDWLARRDEAMRRADASIVAIYAKMRPDAAAAQIASLDDAMAAAVLTKLSPRSASAILSEIPAERAARLTDAIAGARTPVTDPKRTS